MKSPRQGNVLRVHGLLMASHHYFTFQAPGRWRCGKGPGKEGEGGGVEIVNPPRFSSPSPTRRAPAAAFRRAFWQMDGGPPVKQRGRSEQTEQQMHGAPSAPSRGSAVPGGPRLGMSTPGSTRHSPAEIYSPACSTLHPSPCAPLPGIHRELSALITSPRVSGMLVRMRRVWGGC